MSKFNIKYVFIIHSIIALIFGLGFMIIPYIIMDSMGLPNPADLGEPIRFYGAMIFGLSILLFCIRNELGEPIRFYGAMIFGLSILLFCIRNEPHSSMRQAIILFIVVSFIPQLIFHLLFHPLTNFMVWNIIGLDAIFIILYSYFFITNRGK
jgi:hypothetical protein